MPPEVTCCLPVVFYDVDDGPREVLRIDPDGQVYVCGHRVSHQVLTEIVQMGWHEWDCKGNL